MSSSSYLGGALAAALRAAGLAAGLAAVFFGGGAGSSSSSSRSSRSTAFGAFLVRFFGCTSSSSSSSSSLSSMACLRDLAAALALAAGLAAFGRAGASSSSPVSSSRMPAARRALVVRCSTMPRMASSSATSLFFERSRCVFFSWSSTSSENACASDLWTKSSSASFMSGSARSESFLSAASSCDRTRSLICTESNSSSSGGASYVPFAVFCAGALTFFARVK
mmetsp:Transcript_4718/g.14990  ORF Transcript_4718/g.14990 Transcript_4718/m.14990 type:complete len:223 (-) Transcript_4718:1292-1960(-)